MSDKQRQYHINQYWNGPLTRAEAQKVFDETAAAVTNHQQTIMKLDMVVAYLVEKAGHTTEDIQAWMNERVKQMQAKHAAAQAAQPTQEEVPAQEAQPTAPALVTLD